MIDPQTIKAAQEEDPTLSKVREYVENHIIHEKKKGKVSRVPLERLPLIDVPFKRVAVDLVGPLSPVTDKGTFLH